MSSEHILEINANHSVHNSEQFKADDKTEDRQPNNLSVGTTSGLRVGSLLRRRAEVSKINYMSSQPLEFIISGESILRRRSIGLPAKEYSMQCFVSTELRNKSEEDLFAEQFPINVTRLMNEDQLWGCFYTFPELYADVYSPVVHVRSAEDVPEIVGGELTRDTIAPHLSYLKRTPILGDFVYIKLDLSSQHLININILQHYKYIVYLDLSSNLLTELTVLSHLPYLQYLTVAFNRLGTILEYDTPQWFLTEVHYKYNSVTRIRDLKAFWSITVLDLSHNNIKCISGLESLRFLRRLDLSFNHIQRLENLNHLRLLWLDVSYNNISSFEFGPHAGLWTLLHLEYLNVNENNFDSMKIFSACTRLRELHARNNRLSMLLELAVYMRQMRRLIILDLRANPICSSPGYKEVVINTYPILLSLDAEELDPVTQVPLVHYTCSGDARPAFEILGCLHPLDCDHSTRRTFKMEMTPDVHIYATRRLERLLYIEQLSIGRVSLFVPPADTTEVPIVVLVGYEAVGKGALARRLATECSGNIALARQHTTAPYHYPDHYREITRSKFDDMLLAGDFLTYGEMDGESYGLSREEAFIKDGKVKIVSMDLIGALMLKLRGRRPYLILTSCSDKRSLRKRQAVRKSVRSQEKDHRISLERPLESSTLQVLLSGRIIITGILNEIILRLPEEKEKSEFVMESECSLMMDSEARQAVRGFDKGVNLLTLLASSTSSLNDTSKPTQDKNSQNEPSLYSLYKEAQDTDENNSYANGQNSFHGDRKQAKTCNEPPQSKTKQDKVSNVSQPKSVDFSRYTSSTWKGLTVAPDRSKSSKSVTFTSQDNTDTERLYQMDPTGMILEPQIDNETNETRDIRSISTKLPWPMRGMSRLGSGASLDDQDLWLAFLTETGLMQDSDIASASNTDTVNRYNTKIDDTESILQQMNNYHQIPYETSTSTIRDEYEDICAKNPGLFWDTVTMDDQEVAFKKMKQIIQEIVKSQKHIKPMFDANFNDLKYYPNVEKKLVDICKQIAPQRLFY